MMYRKIAGSLVLKSQNWPNFHDQPPHPKSTQDPRLFQREHSLPSLVARHTILCLHRSVSIQHNVIPPEDLSQSV